MDTFFTAAWAILLTAGLALEVSALRRREPGDTLSEHVWRVFRVRDARSTPWTWALRLPLAATMVWLTGHFVFGIWGG